MKLHREVVKDKRRCQKCGTKCEERPVITRFEFLCFLLVENGALDFTEIQKAMCNFDKMDINDDGEINLEDVIGWTNHKEEKRQAKLAERNRRQSRGSRGGSGDMSLPPRSYTLPSSLPAVALKV